MSTLHEPKAARGRRKGLLGERLIGAKLISADELESALQL